MGPGAFADAIDALLGDDQRAIALVLALFVAHLAIGVAALALRRIPRPMIGLNLALAGAILLYKASQYAAYPALIAIARDDLAGNTDVRLILFEAVVAITAVFALAGRRFAAALSVFAAALSVVAFIVHALAAAAFVIFATTFHLDRLM
jgi:hypothetical protein